jgi:hypothetical protein
MGTSLIDTSFNFGYNTPAACLAMAGRLTTWDAVRKFIFAGNAYFTLRSMKTGTRFTYRVRVRQNNDDGKLIHFVSLLRGPNNDEDYAYMGCIVNMTDFHMTDKSRLSQKAMSMTAWMWMYALMLHDQPMPALLEIWHEGRCGRCGKRLTVPESVVTGYGSECTLML